jgi:hypothetical protein
MNNRNWKRLCKGEVQAKQLEFKEVGGNMTKEDEGKTVKIISIDVADECRMIQVGDKGEVQRVDNDLIYVLLKTGLAKGSIYTLADNQLKVVES